MKNKIWAYIILIIALCFVRLLPHPPNLTPIIGSAIVSVAVFKSRFLQFGLPLATMLLSDSILGFHALMPVVYLSISLASLSGYIIKNLSLLNSLGTGFLGSIIFFII